MKNFNIKKGFSIPEVIIAITIVILIIVTATNLLVSSTRANRSNINQIIAYNLAQEAVEGVRNIRDSYWLHNLYWRGEEKLLGDHFDSDEGYYIIEKQHNYFNPDSCSNTSDFLNSITTVKNAAPWILTEINRPDDSRTALYETSLGDVINYTHESSEGEESIFKRWVEIQTIPFESSAGEVRGDLKIAVTAVVAWREQSRTKTLRLPTVLTDWKAGPL
jgi:type II secretory pathway pseudopilin PulG